VLIAKVTANDTNILEIFVHFDSKSNKFGRESTNEKRFIPSRLRNQVGSVRLHPTHTDDQLKHGVSYKQRLQISSAGGSAIVRRH
jgi:hypothetical protein